MPLPYMIDIIDFCILSNFQKIQYCKEFRQVTKYELPAMLPSGIINKDAFGAKSAVWNFKTKEIKDVQISRKQQ